MKLSANTTLVIFSIMLVVAMATFVYIVANTKRVPVCFEAYRYTRDSNGVLWPVQIKGIVQHCQPGDTNAPNG